MIAPTLHLNPPKLSKRGVMAIQLHPSPPPPHHIEKSWICHWKSEFWKSEFISVVDNENILAEIACTEYEQEYQLFGKMQCNETR